MRTALRNLSERQQLLHLLSETQKAILSSVNAAILTVATDGAILSCNVASERLFGFSTSTLTDSMSFDELFDQNGNWLRIQDDDLEELVVTQGIGSLMNHILNLQGYRRSFDCGGGVSDARTAKPSRVYFPSQQRREMI